MFPPATKKELRALGWDALDIILVTGDSWIDSPHIGAAVIANVLLEAGWRVGVIPQPDISGDSDITRLGEPELFWAVTAGCMDSMVANYTATGKKRKSDDLTAGGQNTRRPDRAVIAYTNLIRRYFKQTRPVVLGGMEASLRRISHYDWWSGKVRRSVLFDAKADLIVYGMAEKTLPELAHHLKSGKDITGIRGICYISKTRPEGFTELPSHAEAAADKTAFTRMFHTFYKNLDPLKANGLCQLQDTRYLVCNPGRPPLTKAELDRVHELDFKRRPHPVHDAQGEVRAMDTIKFSIPSHRGCYGECHFCAITAHQGKTVISRSRNSIIREARSLTEHPEFRGVITDVGGPTANMYEIECEKKFTKGACRNKRCLGEIVCSELPVSHEPQIRLLRELKNIPKVRHVFVGSGLRHDLVLADKDHGRAYLKEIIASHVSGQLKIAPEHSSDKILCLMGKPGSETTRRFISLFRQTAEKLNPRCHLTCYFIAAYPGSTMEDMKDVRRFAVKELGFIPGQIQVFTPAPSTAAALMYYTEHSFPEQRPLYVEKNPSRRQKQKDIVQGKKPGPKPGGKT
ncbi:MAG: YgiQ family radical SAM protein [Thermodesulfobacteriota bacterium]